MQPPVMTTNQPLHVYVSNPQPIPSRDRTERLVIPVLPLPVAIVCCVLNFLIPGFGTLVAGVSTFCCGSPDDFRERSDKWMSCASGFGIGFAQLVTSVLLFGLIWSWAWGIYFIYSSCTQYDRTNYSRQSTYSTSFVHIDSPSPVVGQPFYGGLQNGIVETSFMTSQPIANQNPPPYFPNGPIANQNPPPYFPNGPIANHNPPPYFQNGPPNYYLPTNQNGISVEKDYVASVRLP